MPRLDLRPEDELDLGGVFLYEREDLGVNCVKYLLGELHNVSLSDSVVEVTSYARETCECVTYRTDIVEVQLQSVDCFTGRPGNIAETGKLGWKRHLSDVMVFLELGPEGKKSRSLDHKKGAEDVCIVENE